MMDDMLYTYVATYLLSRLAILATVGYVFYLILRPKIQLAHVRK